MNNFVTANVELLPTRLNKDLRNLYTGSRLKSVQRMEDDKQDQINTNEGI